MVIGRDQPAVGRRVAAVGDFCRVTRPIIQHC